MQVGQSRGGKLRVWGVLAWGLVGPPALLIGLPLFLHLDWSHLIRAAPDLAWWMLLYLPACFLLGLVKLRAVIRR